VDSLHICLKHGSLCVSGFEEILSCGQGGTATKYVPSRRHESFTERYGVTPTKLESTAAPLFAYAFNYLCIQGRKNVRLHLTSQKIRNSARLIPQSKRRRCILSSHSIYRQVENT
jgi:hypothetical protein